MSVALFVRAFFWLWFAGAVAMGHWLVLQRLPPLALPALILALTGLLLAAFFRIPGLRRWLDSVATGMLVQLHLLRLVGVYFLVLHQRGDLPRAFALPAGMAEVIIAVMALPIVLAPLAPASRLRAVRIWSIVGLINLLYIVVTLGRLHLADPFQLRLFTTLPLILYPLCLLPLLLAAHVMVLVRPPENFEPM